MDTCGKATLYGELWGMCLRASFSLNFGIVMIFYIRGTAASTWHHTCKWGCSLGPPPQITLGPRAAQDIRTLCLSPSNKPPKSARHAWKLFSSAISDVPVAISWKCPRWNCLAWEEALNCCTKGLGLDKSSDLKMNKPLFLCTRPCKHRSILPNLNATSVSNPLPSCKEHTLFPKCTNWKKETRILL